VSIQYNLTGAVRKAFAVAIGEVIALPVVYTGAPGFAYTVGDYTIDRYGNLSYSDAISINDVIRLVARMREHGYIAENAPDYEKTSETESASNNDALVIEMPMTGFTPDKLDNLAKLVNSKAALIKKVLGVDDLPIAILDDKLRFPWFKLTGEEGEADAYSRFICALCEMVKKQKHITAKAREIENEKFTMRVFLIRLGFIGSEYKTARKVLLKNLTGNGSRRYGRPDRAKLSNNDSNVEETSESEAPAVELGAALENAEAEPYEK